MAPGTEWGRAGWGVNIGMCGGRIVGLVSSKNPGFRRQIIKVKGGAVLVLRKTGCIKICNRL